VVGEQQIIETLEWRFDQRVTTIARPLVDPDLVRQLSLVTVAGRRHEPATASLLRAVRAHAWHEENVPDDPERFPLMSFSKSIRSAANQGRVQPHVGGGPGVSGRQVAHLKRKSAQKRDGGRKSLA
jgi:hypothetical protein